MLDSVGGSAVETTNAFCDGPPRIGQEGYAGVPLAPFGEVGWHWCQQLR